MKNTRLTILAALVMVTPAFAQPNTVPLPGGQNSMPPAGATAPGGTAAGATADSGAVTNAQTTETTTTTTSSPGIDEAGVAVEVDPMMETTELANTGGEPVLMTLFGLSLALGAFAVRKRVSA